MSFLAQNHRFFSSSTSARAALPLSHTGDSKHHQGGLRRRLSSLSLKIQATSAASSWSFPRSKSLSSMGDYAGTSLRKWWEWGSAWFLSRKPFFAGDLEMNEQEAKVLGSQDRGSWRHVFFKVRSEIRKLLGSDQMALPQTYRPAKSFDANHR
ncbi:uncharacterized protein LOC114748600 [Neltuma alba]|uniref:uncharacterized protein LOC114748600 n=1 Tax=Neltuma alba TaxID=207710 RepID=UPI0010A54568|nr:uncharacterized protein LOC114748600 [Prosopis alba]